jgi:hypothetical protein
MDHQVLAEKLVSVYFCCALVKIPDSRYFQYLFPYNEASPDQLSPCTVVLTSLEIG